VGNLQLQDLETILSSNNNTAKEIRRSISDGSYRYCNNKQCSYLLRQDMQWQEQTPKIKIKNLRLAIDDSCNLSCPSCRTKKIFYKSGKRLNTSMLLADKILFFLKKQKEKIHVHIGSDGDPFASLVYRYFMKQADNIEHLTFSIQTNGLLVKQMHPRIKNIFSRLKTLNVSIDGASKETYEKLRKGGSYEKIINNLHFIKEIKKIYGFEFIIHVVVQKDNFNEMLSMIDLAESFRADRIWFNKITDWNTYKDFSKVNILDKNNEEHKEYLKVLHTVIQRAKINKKVLIGMFTLI
jgi:MoaA/NifB/PqqE/SkfB family radical SAM enzyme